MSRRVCIVGTAPTWRQVPWDDPALEVWCLNDMHVLNLPRADRWFDLHPLDKMFFRARDQQLYAHDIPAGYFVRPVGHVEWLRSQTIPVYVQDAAALGSPSAVTFPRAEVARAIGPYFASSPAWMIGLALMEGVSELHVYGIHLATEWEYLKQKPNLMFLLGLAAGRGVKVVIPKGSPLVVESHQYAFEADPDVEKVIVQRKIQRLEQERQAIENQAKGRKWYQRRDPNVASRSAWKRAELLDAQLELQRIVAGRAPAGV